MRISCASEEETLQPRKRTEKEATRRGTLLGAAPNVGRPAIELASLGVPVAPEPRLLLGEISRGDELLGVDPLGYGLDSRRRDVRHRHVGRRQRVLEGLG